MIEIELPDGSVAQFPDGTTDEAIKGALSKAFPQPAQQAAAPKDVGNQPIDASTVYVDDMLFGLAGKAAAGMNALIRAPFTDKSIGEEYDTLRGQYQNAREKYAEEHPIANTAASIGGSIHGGAALSAGTGNLIARGADALTRAAPSVAPAINGVGNFVRNRFAGRMLADAAGGATQGALSAFGHDENIGTSTGIGAAVGGLARPVVAGLGSVANMAGGLIGAGNNGRAQAAIAEAIMRSGRSADDVADDLARAAQDGQPEYMLADALGNSGQRMLTGVARSPGDMRQTISETLQRRQAGQGRRLQNALVEGFGAPQTARQTEDALTALRQAEAGQNYAAARQAAGAVNPSGAIQAADDFLGTGGSLPLTNLADDSIESQVRRARGYLTDGENVLTDFDAAFRAKREIDSMIENGNNSVRSQLIPIRNQLDQALENASDPYRTARDTFRRQSQDIEAADVGRNAAMRGRVEDTIPEFQGYVRPEQQASFRAGYVDPYIADIQKAAGPMTNKARPLISDATAQEFPAFAAPGQGQRLMDRIGREQTMFETANAALGGSKTADNLADIMDNQSFDPSMIGALASGNFKGAALQGIAKAVNNVQGRNQATRDMIARMLLQSEPTQARATLSQAVRRGERLSQTQQALVNALIGPGATAYSR